MTQQEPLVTVVICTYNQSDKISRAIDSVLDQDCDFPYEILIGDDASTDDTRRICEDYASRYPERIRLMPEAPNKGMVDNYFDCVEAARGKYIADCAGDDRWCYRGKLREMAAILEADPEVTAVYSDALLVYPDNRSADVSTADMPGYSHWRKDRRYKGSDILAGCLNHTNALPYILSTALYRRSAVMEVMAEAPSMVRDSRNFGIEDIPVIAAAASRGDAVYLDKVTLEYYQYGETVSNSRSIEKLLRFYCRSLHCSLTLADYYGIAHHRLHDVFDSKSRYLAALAFNSGDQAMRSLVAQTLAEWDLQMPLKARIHLLMMASPGVWKAALWLKKKIILQNG